MSVHVAIAAAVAHGNAEPEIVCVGWVNTVFGDVALHTACNIWLVWAMWTDFLPIEWLKIDMEKKTKKKKHNSLSWSAFESGWYSVAVGLSPSVCALCQRHHLNVCLLFSAVFVRWPCLCW